MFAPVIALPVRRAGPRRGWWFPGATLHLDFRNDRFFGVASGDIACVRASGGTALDVSGKAATFAGNGLRRTDRGLLIEAGATNHALHSNDFTNPAWFVGGGLSRSVHSGGPLGTFTRLALTAGIGSKGVHNVTSYSALGPNTRSLFVRPVSGIRWICIAALAPTTDGVFFDLHNGVVGSTFGGRTGAIESIGNGWFRIEARHTAHASYIYVIVSHADAGSTVTWTAAGTEVVEIAGAQVESGARATSYIETAGTAAARAFDDVHLPLGPWWNGAQGTFIATSALAGPAAGRAVAVANIGGASPGAGQGIGIRGGDARSASATDGASDAPSPALGADPTGLRGRIAGAFRTAPASRSSALNGSVAFDAASAFAGNAGLNRLQLGALTGAGAQPLNGLLEELIFVPRAATLAEMQAWNALT